MINGEKVLAIIPARSGSKRLPNKNIKELVGKPLIGWTINAATESKYIDRVVVSTDSEKIIEIAEEYGADCPFVRPAVYATDSATTIDVVMHAINYLAEEELIKYKYVMILQPTSPLRTTDHIDSVCELLKEKKAEAIVSLCEAEHSPLWCGTLPKDMSLSGFINSEINNLRSQDLPGYYRLNGAIYLISIDKLQDEKTIFLKDNIYGFLMPVTASIDIDTLYDFKFAEIMMLEDFEVKNE